MSFNKSKAMRNAERYLTQGKIQAAINEYKHIVENEPKDINSRNMLGDLYTKADENQSAVNCYKEVAEYYYSQGFAKKAIAIYNKIYRIEPNSLEIALKLADLYQTRGSLAEAQRHYQDIARRYEDKGRKVEALAIWEKIAEISPRDTEIYIKIADAYWKEDRKSEAAEAFVQAGSRFAEAEKYEEAVTAFSRSLEVNPEDFFALRGFVKAQVKLGYPEEGARALEELLEKQPYNKELNYLLMDCYFEMGDPQKAEELIIKLVEREPANYPKLLDLVRVYLDIDDLDSATRILSMTSEHMLVGGESEELFGLLNEVLARNPEHINALRLLARYYGWQRDELELQQTLKRLFETARLTQSFEDERYALSQYLLLVPHDVGCSERLQEINDLYGFDDDLPEEQLLHMGSKEIPTFESFAELSGDETESEQGFQVVSEENVIVADNLDETVADESSGTDELKGFKAHVLSAAVENTRPAASNGSHGPASNGGGKIDPDAELSPSDEMKVSEELESIRFYIDQGYKSLAEKALHELVEQYGHRPEFADFETKLKGKAATSVNGSGTNGAGSAAFENNSKLPAVDVTVLEKQPEAVEETIEPVVAEETYEVETFETAEQTVSAEDEPPMVTEPETVGASVEVATIYPTSFDSMRDELGLEDTESVEPDDYEEHYQHAVVYQEMGMLEEAIREYQDAVNCIKSDDGTQRFLNCCTLIGHCFMQKEMPNLALKWFERALETSGLSIEEKQGVDYELGNAFEANGEPEKAFEHFEMVYAVDVDYRDVSERLEKLRDLIPTAV